MTKLLSATKERAKWVFRAGPMVFSFGCWFYVDAFQTGDMVSALLGGLLWMGAVAQWSLEHMDAKTQ